MFSLIAVFERPGWGELLTVSNIGFADEPVLVPVTCSKCKMEWQIMNDKINGTKIEERIEH
jgi:hypothetical protein